MANVVGISFVVATPLQVVYYLGALVDALDADFFLGDNFSFCCCWNCYVCWNHCCCCYCRINDLLLVVVVLLLLLQLLLMSPLQLLLLLRMSLP